MATITQAEFEHIARKWGATALPFSREKSEQRFYINGIVLIYKGGVLYAPDGKTPIDRWFTRVVGLMSDLYKASNDVDDLHTMMEVLAIVS